MNKSTKVIISISLVLLAVFLFAGGKSDVFGGARSTFSTSTAISVTTASTQLLGASGTRSGVIFQLRQTSTSTVWISCGFAAVVGNGFQLTTTTQSRYESDSNAPANCAWYAISDNANTSVGVSDF